jgi:cysteine synthase
MDNSYKAVTARKNQIMMNALGIDYTEFERGPLAFDYEGMMRKVGYPVEEVIRIQAETGVGNTPLIELRNITEIVRKTSRPGFGARIFIKDEAANPSGSFKARRAALSVYEAKRRGYKGVIAATSGNYGAAVASQAAIRGLDCIIVQEVYDSRGYGQPEVIEKGRACEAYGAEVIQLTVGPELFYLFLLLLEETGYFNSSLYTPFGISGIETLGYELAFQARERTGHDPDIVMVTHAGGGNITGTSRGLKKAGCTHTQCVGASVDLSGLHMASDRDFNRKSFTTGHTGFGVPFATWPDRVDVPRNAARPLRYLERYLTVTQGETFYVTEALAQIEGLERGPAGNVSLAAAMSLARELERNRVIVVQETEYTGAGKHPMPQLTFARENGVIVRRGDPVGNKPGETIVIPEHPSQIQAKDFPLDNLRRSYIRNAIQASGRKSLDEFEFRFLIDETSASPAFIGQALKELGVTFPG